MSRPWRYRDRRAVLICHAGDAVNEIGIAHWLAWKFSLAGVIRIHDPLGVKLRRVGNELRRVGPVRFLDVLAFRVFYRITRKKLDDLWIRKTVADLQCRYPADLRTVPSIDVASPNEPRAERFLRELQPDFALARCKRLLVSRVFSVPRHGTFVLHPGMCPEYRNAHGCFWAIARGEPHKAVATLLQVDEGIDTGPVFGYFGCRFDPLRDSHIVIQHRVVTDNLEAIARRLDEICDGRIEPLETRGRPSRCWGQPWLTAYLQIRRRYARSGVRPDTIAPPDAIGKTRNPEHRDIPSHR